MTNHKGNIKKNHVAKVELLRVCLLVHEDLEIYTQMWNHIPVRITANLISLNLAFLHHFTLPSSNIAQTSGKPGIFLGLSGEFQKMVFQLAFKFGKDIATFNNQKKLGTPRYSLGFPKNIYYFKGSLRSTQ